MDNVTRHIEALRAGDPPLKELRKVKLLTPAFANAKTAKNQGKGYDSHILHLAPFKVSGHNMCSAASVGCAAACLNTAGRGRFDRTQQSRIRKTLYFVKAQKAFLGHLRQELRNVEKRAREHGLKAVVRLNGTSDLPWERFGIFEEFPNIQFYDYTKVIMRLRQALPANYHVTFSASESNDDDCREAIQLGYNVATVFSELPREFWGCEVINGDAHDLRFLDPADLRPVIVGLTAKGKAKQDASGFVKQTRECYSCGDYTANRRDECTSCYVYRKCS